MKSRSTDPSEIARAASFLWLGAALVSEPAREEGRRFDESLTSQILRATGWDRPRIESGEEAWLALVKLEEELENHAYAIAQSLSSAEWLFFLRRVPWFFAGFESPSDTGGYATTIAESVTAWSATRPRPSEAAPPWVAYPIDPTLVKAITRLGVIAFHFQNVQAVLRCAGKGAVITSREGLTPGTVPNPELDEMMALWDRRMRAPGYDFLAQAGLYTHKFHTVPDRADYPDLVPIVSRSDNGRFSLMPLPLGALPTLLDSTLPVELRCPTAVLDLIVLLISASLGRMVKHKDKDKRNGLKLQIGQFELIGLNVVPGDQMLGELEIALALVKEHRLGRSIPESVAFGSPREILARLTWSDVSVWPPSMGPAIREAADGLRFEDLWAATRRLERALARPAEMAGGEYANAWSAHFEMVVQDAINASPWKPSPKMADLRGLHLTVGHNRITDIDAIGEHDGRLLLVSCKCIPFSEAWSRGEYKAVINVASAVDLAVAHWEDRLDKLRGTPHGDNYDFSAARELIGVVVLPSLPWTPTVSSVAETTPGLRTAVSASEFDTWINGRVSSPQDSRPRAPS